MENIDIAIQDFINMIRKEYPEYKKIPAYSYNDYEKFIPHFTPIYYSGPYFTDDEVIASVKTLLTGKWMSAGENVESFEKAFSKKIRSLFSVMVNSGSSANLVMIASLKKYFGWEDGDEIIVSVVGFPTTISVLPQNNLKPVFVDIEMETLNFDVSKIEEKITDKTRAIFLSPVLGNPPNINHILNICSRNNILLILDNCDSLGSKWDGRFLNEYSIASSCSFYAAHEICTFEGGMVSTTNRGLANIFRSMTNWGRDCVCSGTENLLPDGICRHRFDKWLEDYDGIVDHKYVFANIGYNLKPIDMMGAVGLEQIKKLDEIVEKRNLHKFLIGSLFEKHIPTVRVPKQLEYAETVWFGCPVICETKEQKQKLVRYLEDNKIQTRNYFAGNILLHPGYKHLDDFNKYPNANEVLDKVFFVGVNPAYTPAVIDYIEEVLKEFKDE